MRFPFLLLLAALGLLEPSLSLKARYESESSIQDIDNALVAIESRGFVEDIWDKVKDATTCAGCQSVLTLLKGLAALGDRTFVRVIQEICKISGTEDDDVCEGAVALEGPIIAEGIRDMKLGSKPSHDFCITFMGLCPYPKIDEWTIPFPSKKPSQGRPSPSGKEPLKVVHYSDIHIDPLYVEGSSTDCNKPICCRPWTKEDEPGNAQSPAGPNGDHNCDVPMSLEQSMYAAINEVVPDAAFTVFTGDMIDHAIWNTSQSYNEAEIQRSYGVMNESLSYVYGTAGNHEEHPTNAFQPNSFGDKAQWIYGVLSKEWSRWIGADATADAEKLGAYSTKWPGGNLRVISLNTNMYYRQNYYLYRKKMLQDPSGQIDWLVKELDKAEKAGENVYIIGHMPLGDHNTFRDQSNYLDQVVRRYEATIAAMFFGHTHRDEFMLSYSDNSKKSFSTARTTSYIGPSLTPTSGHPSFRVYEVDPETFAVMDTITYMADMGDDAFQTSGPVWKKYYSAKEAYGSRLEHPVTDAQAELSAAFWHNVTELFERDASVFGNYMTRKSRGWKKANCGDSCREEELCKMRASRSQDNCFTPSPGISFKKRTESRTEERDECGISVSRATIGSLAVKREVLETLHRRYVEEAKLDKRRRH